MTTLMLMINIPDEDMQLVKDTAAFFNMPTEEFIACAMLYGIHHADHERRMLESAADQSGDQLN